MRQDDPKRRQPAKRDPLADPTRHAFFGGRRKDGEPCFQFVVEGTETCRMHAGMSAAKIRAKGNVMVELKRWGLDGHTTLRDAGEVLLRLVTQSASRVELYSQLLGEAFEAAERVRQASAAGALVVAEKRPTDGDEEMGERPELQAARADLERVFAVGGVGALIGVKRDADRYGRLYDVEEAVRGLARLEAEERDRCASFAAKAVAAGLAERQVRLAEQQGMLLVAAIRAILADLSLSADQLLLVGEVVPRHLRAIGAATIDP